MQEENTALEAQNKRLQSLVCELLLTNQKLRIELNQLQQQKPSTQKGQTLKGHPMGTAMQSRGEQSGLYCYTANSRSRLTMLAPLQE